MQIFGYITFISFAGAAIVTMLSIISLPADLIKSIDDSDLDIEQLQAVTVLAAWLSAMLVTNIFFQTRKFLLWLLFNLVALAHYDLAEPFLEWIASRANSLATFWFGYTGFALEVMHAEEDQFNEDTTLLDIRYLYLTLSNEGCEKYLESTLGQCYCPLCKAAYVVLTKQWVTAILVFVMTLDFLENNGIPLFL